METPHSNDPTRTAVRRTPRELGYRMPAEWEPHAATWLTWPRRDGISFPDRFDAIPAFWVHMVELLSPGEHVHINTFDDDHESEIRELLDRSARLPRDRVHLHRFPAYEPWCRDHGPMFITRPAARTGQPSELAVVDWDYNAWGGKYPPFDLDDAVPQHVARYLNLPLFQPGIVLEGGSVDVNGRGSLLTSEACLLHPNRNPTLTRPEIEQALRDYLGVDQILWLGDGIAGDDTDGHIDDLARFVSSTTIVTVVEEDPADENYGVLQENLRRLQSFVDRAGRPFRIVTLPMPRPIHYNGQRLPACYANFYIANRVVLVPIFDDPNDAAALAVLRELFPDREVIGIQSVDLIWGLGAFHCVTQQQPAK